jgi:hypothetical protein
METIINSISIKTILLLIIPILLFLIMMNFEYSQLSKYSMILGMIMNPLFKTLAEPKVKEVQEKLKERKKIKEAKKKTKKQ